MKNIILFLGATIIALFVLVSCSQNSNKQKELELRERELELKEKGLALKEKDTVVEIIQKADPDLSVKPSEIKKSSPNEKVMTMILKDYSVGDNAYLVFNDVATGEEYQFMLSSDTENRFNGIKLLLEDDNAEFGVMANPKYLNKSFVVEAVYETVLMNGFDGETVRDKMWAIKDLKLSK
jgi:hypothetical protein